MFALANSFANFARALARLSVVLFAGCAAMIAFGDDAGFNASMQGRNASASLRRFGAPEAVSMQKAVAVPYAKNLQLEPEPAKPACAQTLPATCRAPVTTLQFELTSLREALPETARLKPKSVSLRHRMIVIAYTFK